MKLADKQVYPFEYVDIQLNNKKIIRAGITYKEKLVLALAGNPAMLQMFGDKFAERIITHADAIIKQMEKK